MHTYRKSKSEPLWTVGYYVRGDGGFDVWVPLMDCGSEQVAIAMVNTLNGGER